MHKAIAIICRRKVYTTILRLTKEIRSFRHVVNYAMRWRGVTRWYSTSKVGGPLHSQVTIYVMSRSSCNKLERNRYVLSRQNTVWYRLIPGIRYSILPVVWGTCPHSIQLLLWRRNEGQLNTMDAPVAIEADHHSILLGWVPFPGIDI